jgi:hypothetical protein
MFQTRFFLLSVSAIIQFILSITLAAPSLAQDWAVRARPHGTFKVVDLFQPESSVMTNYCESLVGLDRNNNRVPYLAQDYRTIGVYKVKKT